MSDLTIEEKEIVNRLLTIARTCTPNTDLKEWSAGISGDYNPFKSGKHCYWESFSNVLSGRRILEHLKREGISDSTSNDISRKTDDNITIKVIYLEYQRNVGT